MNHAKIKNKNPYSSIYSENQIKKIVKPNQQNPDEFILSFDKAPVISKSLYKEISKRDFSRNQNLN